jgi:ribonuclease HI
MYPSKFQPPQATDKPESLFADEHRFIRNSDPREILIYTDGSCLDNGQSNPRGGCAFVYRPSAYTQTGSLTHRGIIPFRLETKGPTGYSYKQTSNRAELRAVIAALQFRDWSMDCNRSWRSLVIATDSEYGRCSQSTDSLPVCRELSLLSRHVSRLNNS